MRPDETSATGDQNTHGRTVKTKAKRSNRRLALTFAALVVFLLAAAGTMTVRLVPELTRSKEVDRAFQLPSPFQSESLPTATRFDFPLGSEHGAMAYNAQRFTENKHLGDDL